MDKVQLMIKERQDSMELILKTVFDLKTDEKISQRIGLNRSQWNRYKRNQGVMKLPTYLALGDYYTYEKNKLIKEYITEKDETKKRGKARKIFTMLQLIDNKLLEEFDVSLDGINDNNLINLAIMTFNDNWWKSDNIGKKSENIMSDKQLNKLLEERYCMLNLESYVANQKTAELDKVLLKIIPILKKKNKKIILPFSAKKYIRENPQDCNAWWYYLASKEAKLEDEGIEIIIPSNDFDDGDSRYRILQIHASGSFALDASILKNKDFRKILSNIYGDNSDIVFDDKEFIQYFSIASGYAIEYYEGGRDGSFRKINSLITKENEPFIFVNSLVGIHTLIRSRTDKYDKRFWDEVRMYLEQSPTISEEDRKGLITFLREQFHLYYGKEE